MKKILKEKKYMFIIFAVFTILILSISLLNKEMQNDTFYTIKVGEAISKYGVDMKDHFSFIPDLKYYYPHWLYDLGIYKIYNSFGFPGLVASSVVLTFTLCLGLFITSIKITNNKGISFLVTLFASAFLNPFVTVRAQLVSYILLLLILFCIEMLRKNGKYRYLILLAVLSILLANIHAAVYPVIFLLFLPFLVSDLCYKFLKKYKNSIIEIDKPHNTKLLLIGLLICIICGFLTVSNSTYTYILYILMGSSTKVIEEHAPTSMINNPFLFMYLGIIIATLFTKKIKIKLNDIFMIGGLFLLTLLSLRSFALFVILSVYSFVRIYSNVESNYLKNINITMIFSMPKVMIITILLIALTGFYNLSLEMKESYIDETSYPTEMVKYIKENMDYKNMRIYHEYNIGSYLMLNDIKVFIDSRSDLYMKEFNKDCTVFEDAMSMPYNYKDVLNKYDFTHLLLYNGDSFNNVVELLPDYKLVRRDRFFTLYEKVKAS